MSAELKVGDHLTWTASKSNGYRISFRTMEGRVVELRPNYSSVKMRNGRSVQIRNSDLRRAGEKTEVTELLEAMAKPAQTEGER